MKNLKQLIIEVDSLADTQEFMQERMELRFKRVGLFLAYLSGEERKERQQFSLDSVSGILGWELMPDIIAQYTREREWIEQRLKEKSEKQPDDTLTLDDKIPDLPDIETESE